MHACRIPPLHNYYNYSYSGTPQAIMDTFGEQCFGLYTEVAFIQRWPLLRGYFLFGTGRYIVTGLYSEVVVNKGSTVHVYYI